MVFPVNLLNLEIWESQKRQNREDVLSEIYDQFTWPVFPFRSQYEEFEIEDEEKEPPPEIQSLINHLIVCSWKEIELMKSREYNSPKDFMSADQSSCS